MLDWIQNWFITHCDEKWNDFCSIKIESIDNPGWLVRIEISETELVNKPFKEIHRDISDSDWLICRVREEKYEGIGDGKKLNEILEIFRQWVES